MNIAHLTAMFFHDTPIHETVRPEPVEGWFDKLTTNGVSR
jgi:hypothetical protein